jgi:hypothetical protein
MTNGANWAKLWAIYMVMWIIRAFMNNKEFHIFTVHLYQIYNMFRVVNRIVVELEIE